jgi:hypothetical protein
VITSQTAAYQSEQTLANISGQRMVSAVGLIKSLGGGWDVGQMNTDPAAPAAASANTPAAAPAAPTANAASSS